MAGTDAAWAPDVDFVEYVQARQHTLLRAAYLVCGDADLARDVLRDALVRLARQWDRVREDRPDLFVRRALYRGALATRRTDGDGEVGDRSSPDEVRGAGWDAPAMGPGGWDSGLLDADPWDAEEAERRRAVLEALDTLTPRQRAAVVLRFFDDRDERDTGDVLGCSSATVRTETDQALARLRAAAPQLDVRTGGAR